MVDGGNHMRLSLLQPKEIRVPAHTIAEIESELRPIKYLKVDAEGHEKKNYINFEPTCPAHQSGIQLSSNVRRACGIRQTISSALISRSSHHATSLPA
jgi:hypothetical protein